MVIDERPWSRWRRWRCLLLLLCSAANDRRAAACAGLEPSPLLPGLGRSESSQRAGSAVGKDPRAAVLRDGVGETHVRKPNRASRTLDHCSAREVDELAWLP